MGNPGFGQLVSEAQMVVGEKGQDFFLRIKHLLAGAIVGQAKTDKAIMHQAVPVRCDDLKDLNRWHIGRIVNGRCRWLRIFGVRFGGVELEDEESLFRHVLSKFVKDCAYMGRAGQDRKMVGVARILQKRKIITFLQVA